MKFVTHYKVTRSEYVSGWYWPPTESQADHVSSTSCAHRCRRCTCLKFKLDMPLLSASGCPHRVRIAAPSPFGKFQTTLLALRAFSCFSRIKVRVE
jgi:hypothetical protein